MVSTNSHVRRALALALCALCAALALCAAAPASARADEGSELLDEIATALPEGSDAVVEESGIAFETVNGIYFAEDEWWTYLTDTSAIYFRTAANATDTPDVTSGVADDEWGAQFAASSETEYLGAVGYDNDTVSFYSYFFYDDSGGTAYVDFRTYIPLSDGSVTALYGFLRSDDIDATLGIVDQLLMTVELGTGANAVAPSGETVVCGDFAFTLPDVAEFELAAGEDGSITGTFQGPVGECAIMFFSFDLGDNVIATEEDLVEAGDSFMSGVAEGAAVEGGEVLDHSIITSENGIGLYYNTYISSEIDGLFALVPNGDTLVIAAVFDTGEFEDFELSGEVILSIANSAAFAEGVTSAFADEGAAAEGDAAQADGTDAAADAGAAEGSTDAGAAEGADAAASGEADASGDTGSGLSDIFDSIDLDDILTTA